MLGITTTDDASEWEDEEILIKSQSSPWLYTILVKRYQDPFMRKTRSIIHNPLDAEEVVQDAFTKIYINADKFEPQAGAKFSSWAYRILLNTAFTRYQKVVKEGQRFTNIDPEYEHLFGEESEHRGFEEKRDGIERILERMPGHFALVLRLHYLERWSHQDIADKTGENVGTIKARIHRAKVAFRKEGKDGEVEVLID
ncbi:RNA polymerase sigma factor [Candidatus Kaiserbacteria bacterium]|nr:RNA polymerase sigma factor [Candidatus Kaiserbacteria bacterium]USN92692.1 MAG: RNA polymerase sigma factor [Candidatus Nomurabacteria bacterium]